MATLSEHIGTLREKPAHVRERIAFFTASGVTGLVALLWAVAMTTSGAFTLAPTTVASDSTTSDVQKTFAEGKSNLSQLASVINSQGTSSSAGITVVDVRASSTLDAADPNTQTVLTF